MLNFEWLQPGTDLTVLQYLSIPERLDIRDGQVMSVERVRESLSNERSDSVEEASGVSDDI